MSILIIGDLHIKNSNLTNISIIQTDIMNILTSGKRKIAFVVILGDTLNDHGHIDLECLNVAADLFESIMSTGIPLFVLIGNHDRKDHKVYMTDRHPFRGFNGRPGIVIVHKCFTYTLPVRSIGIDSDQEMKFCFVPFVPDGMYMKALSDCNINPNEITMFFSHSEFKGCNINKLSKSECDEWPLDYSLNISGHIHDREIVQDNLIYVGTPFQHTYKDSSEKGIYLMDLTNGEFKLEMCELRIPKKIIVKVHYTQLDRIQLDPKYDIRLEIHGPTQYVRELMSRPDLTAKFSGLSKKYIDESTGTPKSVELMMETPVKLNFHEQLMIKAAKDEKIKLVLQNITPMIKM